MLDVIYCALLSYIIFVSNHYSLGHDLERNGTSNLALREDVLMTRPL